MLQSLIPAIQVKVTDNGRPQRSSTARLHIEWIRRPPPSTLPLLFDEQFYNFTVMENDKVSEIVGVVSLQQSSALVWFDITGKHPPVGEGDPLSAGGELCVVWGSAWCVLVCVWGAAQILWPCCMICYALPIPVATAAASPVVRSWYGLKSRLTKKIFMSSWIYFEGMFPFKGFHLIYKYITLWLIKFLS